MESLYRGRRAATIENELIRLTVLREGGHIAEIFHKPTGVNPLWTPPWDSIEPSLYDAARNPEYGTGAEARLLAGLMGHNLCLDLFGGPSPEEEAAGMTVHGEASVAPFEFEIEDGVLRMGTCLPGAELRFERTIELRGGGVRIRETVDNLSICDRPAAWTQHVTLGPPFVEPGVTRFEAPATRSKVFESPFGSADYLKPGAEFDWPHAPRPDGGSADLRLLPKAAASGAFTTHLMDPSKDDAYFIAFHPGLKLALGYMWKRADFPWLGIWEENHSRTAPPWNGKTLTRGMEFGASPIPESRRAMIDRHSLFGVPTYRWFPAGTRVEVVYSAVLETHDRMPEALAWPDSPNPQPLTPNP
jgi:hypothetical protein